MAESIIAQLLGGGSRSEGAEPRLCEGPAVQRAHRWIGDRRHRGRVRTEAPVREGRTPFFSKICYFWHERVVEEHILWLYITVYNAAPTFLVQIRQTLCDPESNLEPNIPAKFC
jgi:hypothetical protein